MVTSISIGAVALMLGVCINTVRAWHACGFLVPIYRTAGGHRRYDPADVAAVMRKNTSEQSRKTLAYARVSTHDQKKDLETQVARLKIECDARGWLDAEVVADLGSGMNYTKKGLRRLIGMLCRKEIGRLVVMRQDRLLRFGAELVFELCKHVGCEVVVIEPVDRDPRKTISEDVLAILTVFSARCNGLRSHSNKRAIAAVST
jgi:predicted site-specific integrase-resolvase